MSCNSYEEVEAIISKYKKEIENIEVALIEIITFMKGSISWNEVWMLSSNNIVKIRNQIKKNIELYNKTGFSVF